MIPKPLLARDHEQSPLPECSPEDGPYFDCRVGYVLSQDDMNLHRRFIREAKGYYEKIKDSYTHLKYRQGRKRKALKRLHTKQLRSREKKSRRSSMHANELPDVITLSSDTEQDENDDDVSPRKSNDDSNRESNIGTGKKEIFGSEMSFDSSQPPNEYDNYDNDIVIVDEVHRAPAFQPKTFDNQAIDGFIDQPSTSKQPKPFADDAEPSTSQQMLFDQLLKDVSTSSNQSTLPTTPTINREVAFTDERRNERPPLMGVDCRYQLLDISLTQIASTRPPLLTNKGESENRETLDVGQQLREIFADSAADKKMTPALWRSSNTIYQSANEYQRAGLLSSFNEPIRDRTYQQPSSLVSVLDRQMPLEEDEIKRNLVKALTSNWKPSGY